jgi:hypothetical protein
MLKYIAYGLWVLVLGSAAVAAAPRGVQETPVMSQQESRAFVLDALLDRLAVSVDAGHAHLAPLGGLWQ